MHLESSPLDGSIHAPQPPARVRGSGVPLRGGPHWAAGTICAIFPSLRVSQAVQTHGATACIMHTSHRDMCARRLASDLSEDEYTSLAQTRRLLRSYLAFSERAAQAAGLEPRQYQLLLMLRGLTGDGVASVSDLADWLQVRHHSAVGLIDRMQARGLVERQSDPQDGRRVLLRLTPAGRAALRGLAVLHRDELRSVASSLVAALQTLLAASAGSVPSGPGVGVQLTGSRK